MKKTCDDGLTRHYRAALSDYATAARDGRAMAEVMAHFAGQLGGEPQDLDGPPLETLPTRSEVLRTLRQRDAARARLEREWDRLSDAAKVGLPSPDELDDGEG